MKNPEIDLVLVNKSLRREFSAKGLNPEKVMVPDPKNLPRENHVLKMLLDWVNAYKQLGGRKQMEAAGYDFPPIEPDYDPDSDWKIFELWLAGEPTELKIGPKAEFFRDISNLSDAEVAKEIDYLDQLLEQHSILLDILDKDMPPRLVYNYLSEELTEDSFPLLASGSNCHIDGCSGYCPDCFQRPWCENGYTKWREDEELGKMHLTAVLDDFVSATPFSLKLLEDEDF